MRQTSHQTSRYHSSKIYQVPKMANTITRLFQLFINSLSLLTKCRSSARSKSITKIINQLQLKHIICVKLMNYQHQEQIHR